MVVITTFNNLKRVTALASNSNMIVAAYECGKIIRYLREKDSLEAKYSSMILQEKGTEVVNIKISQNSNYFISHGED